MAEQWLSIVEYARTFSISDMTVRRRIKTGKLHAVLKEGKYYIPVKKEPKHSQASEPRMPSYPKHHGHLSLEQDQDEGELEIIRSKPRVEVNPRPKPRKINHEPSSRQNDKEASFATKLIPEAIKEPLQSVPQMTLKGDALLGFCEGVLSKLQGYEDSLKETYESKISAMQAQLSQKNTELAHLSQQLEDLQVLVKILEKRT